MPHNRPVENRKITCDRCGGHGEYNPFPWEQSYGKEKCLDCDGVGYAWVKHTYTNEEWLSAIQERLDETLNHDDE